jgi:preprotein translocase SecE subunit
MADQKPAKKPKRLVKNPETFRERAVKAAENDGQPKRSSKVGQAGRSAVRPVATPLKPLAKAGRKAGRVILPRYVRNSWQELRKVTWPDWKQSRQLTTAVLIFAVVFGAIIALVDWGLDRLFRDILLK